MQDRHQRRAVRLAFSLEFGIAAATEMMPFDRPVNGERFHEARNEMHAFQRYDEGTAHDDEPLGFGRGIDASIADTQTRHLQARF